MRLAKLLTLIFFYLLSTSYGFSLNVPGGKSSAPVLKNNFNFSSVPGGPADAGEDQDICDLLTAVLEGNDPAPGTGAWSVSSGPGNVIFDDPNQYDTPVSVDQHGSYTFTWTVDDGTITSDDVTVNFYEQPVADAGSGGDECDLDFTLSATPGAGSGIWSMTDGTGTATFLPDASDPNATVEVSEYGTKEFTWTETNGSCSDAATVTVNFYRLPEATISGSAEVCQGESSPAITFTGSSGIAPYTFTYTVNGGSAQTVTTVSGDDVNVPVSTVTPGSFIYELQSVKDSSPAECEQAQSGTATVSVNPLPQATISGTASICQFSGSADITFTGSGGTAPYTFSYTVNSGPVRTVTTDSGNSVDIPVASDNTGSYTYTLLSVTDGSSTSCERSVSGSATVTVLPLPEAEITGSTTVCQDSPSPEIVFNGSNGTEPYTFTYTVNGGPHQTISTSSGSSVNLAVPTTIPGTYTFELVNVEDAGTTPCSNPDSGTVIIQIDEMPVADAGQDADICGLSYNLSATATTGTGTWTMTSGTGTATFLPGAGDPDATVEVSEYGTKEFTWTVVNGLCSDIAVTEITFHDQSQADAGTGGVECDLDFELSAIPESGTGSWSLLSGPGQAVFSPSVNDPEATVTVDTTGLYEFLWTEQNQVCQSVDTVEVQFRSLPELFAGRDTVICEDASVQLAAEGNGEFLWEPSAGLDNDTVFNPVAGPDTSTVYTVRLTDQYGCTNYDDIRVEVLKQPVADAGPDKTLWYTFETELNAQLAERESGRWELIRGAGTVGDTTAATTTITGLTIGENVLLWTVTNGVCPESSDYLRIYVNDLLIPSLITPNMDGRNDFFVLKGIQNLGQTELVIFDRSGVKVYENTDYDNSWDGTDQKGNALPEDTYFYVMRSTKGGSQSGYIVIRR
ncbi:MAG: gliding motility-associated C-terminal domain-containing protein [Bacteroidales bacterium]